MCSVTRSRTECGSDQPGSQVAIFRIRDFRDRMVNAGLYPSLLIRMFRACPKSQAEDQRQLTAAHRGINTSMGAAATPWSRYVETSSDPIIRDHRTTLLQPAHGGRPGVVGNRCILHGLRARGGNQPPCGAAPLARSFAAACFPKAQMLELRKQGAQLVCRTAQGSAVG